MLAPIPGLILVDLVRFERAMVRIHRLGGRITLEHAATVARQTDPMISLAVAEEFARLDAAWIVAAGADRLVPRHLLVVPR